MKALVSGQVATAVCFDIDRIFSFDINRSQPYSERQEWEIPLLFADAHDVAELEQVSLEQVEERLNLAWQQDRGLQLLLLLLDQDEHDDVKQSAAECLDEFFLNERVKEFVANRLYAAPLPESADITSAMDRCENFHLRELGSFLKSVVDDQHEIAARGAAWDELPWSLFTDPEEKRAFRRQAIAYGAFRLFVAERGKSDAALLHLLVHPVFRGNHKARAIFQAWAAPFRETITSTKFTDEDIDEASQDDGRIRRADRFVQAHERLEKVDSQKERIKAYLVKGNEDLALSFTRKLVEHQHRNSEPEHLAKSLCDLAQFAKGLGSPELQLKFASMAIEEAPHDAWSHSTVGDAYRSLEDFGPAIEAYRKAGVLGDEQIAVAGKAEVLRDLGQHKEALQVYEQSVQDFPNNRVLLNGRAATLATAGRLQDALIAYNDVLERWPFDPITIGGRAQVLREMGCLDEAFGEWEKALAYDPGNRIPLHARADILRDLGRVDEAASEFLKLRERFPFAIENRLAYAKVQRDLGNFNAAIDEYKKAIHAHPFVSTPRTGLADTYKKLGYLVEALTTYDDVLQNFQRTGPARNGKASVLVVQGHFSEALELLPNLLPATQYEWVAYHIRGMAYMKSGDLTKAEAVLQHGVINNPWSAHRQYFQTALASLRVQQGKYGDALELLRDNFIPSVAPIARAIAMHASGEMRNSTLFFQLKNLPTTSPVPIVAKLQDAITDRYQFSYRSNTLFSPSIVFELECHSLLLAA